MDHNERSGTQTALTRRRLREDLKRRIAIKLKTSRKARKLTQEALADLIGRSVDTVSTGQGPLKPGYVGGDCFETRYSNCGFL